jgi:hypothetical protein
MKRRLSRLRRERGAVIVVVAAFMASAIALVTFVVDVGHWFEHKRHLQLQVDNGAFAGATEFNKCFAASTADRANPASAANTAIQDQARKYSGDTVNNANALNPQVNNRPNVTVVINSTKYPGDGGTDYDDPAGPPCKSAYVDLKATDANLPLFFASSVVPKINAHARVSMKQISSLGGSLPMAVEDVNPIAVGALVVNEDLAGYKTSAAGVLGRQALTAGAATTLNGQSLVPWTGGPVSVSISSPTPPSAISHNGVVFALCSNQTLCGSGTTWLNGTVAAVCGRLFVQCYNGDQTGLEFIHGYSTAGIGTAATPIVRSVTLTKGGSGACTDDSAPYFMLNGGCTIGVQANVDFGLTGDPTADPPTGVNATVKVGSCTLSYTGSSGTTSSWSAANCQNIASGAGQVPLNLNWTTGTKKTGGVLSGTFATVARPFANDGATDTQSYPIAYAQVTQGSLCTGGVANSVPFGTTNLCFGIGVLGNLKVAADASDPIRLLKFNSGSHTGAIQCGWGTGADALRDAIQYGCKTPVQRNPGEACPGTLTPVDCLPVETGGKVGPTRQGMQARFEPNGVCQPNHWADYFTGGLQPGDPRIVPLIITLYGAFAGSGGGYVPVTDFGVFYVTGFDGDSGCTGDDPAPPGAGNGTIWGHFISYAGDLGSSTGGSGCTFNSQLSPCIAVLTD